MKLKETLMHKCALSETGCQGHDKGICIRNTVSESGS